MAKLLVVFAICCLICAGGLAGWYVCVYRARQFDARWATLPVWDRADLSCPVCGFSPVQLYEGHFAKPVMQIYCPNCHSWHSKKIVPKAEAQ